MSERECPFVPRINPVECPQCGSQEVNVQGGDPAAYCDECGYKGPKKQPNIDDTPNQTGWNPLEILRRLGL